MCIYEDINTAFACINMDLQSLKSYADQPEKVQEIEARINRNIEHGQQAVKRLAEQTKAIQETLLTIYPVNMSSNLDHYMEGQKDAQKNKV